MRVGVLTGLSAEARLLRKEFGGATREPIVLSTGADPLRAQSQAEWLVPAGAIAIVSFGLAGGVNPKLKAGDLICADRVILPEGRSIVTDPVWVQSALRRMKLSRSQVAIGPIGGTDRPLTTIDEKRHFASRSGALAADMESASAAIVAEHNGLPLLVVRAVSDSADRALPTVARIPLLPSGDIRLASVAQALCALPVEWPAVARLALDTRAALGALRDVVRSGALLPPSGRLVLAASATTFVEDEYGRSPRARARDGNGLVAVSKG